MKFIGQLLGQHLQRYPAMQLADIYKLLHQAALGAGHAVSDRTQALAALESECRSAADGPAEPLIDRISPDGRLARVHLRTYLAQGHDLPALADAFAHTPQAYPAAPEKLAKYCACLGDLADAGGIPFTRAEVTAWFDDVVARNYPVVRHSQMFHDAYHPAYRVVAAELLPALN